MVSWPMCHLPQSLSQQLGWLLLRDFCFAFYGEKHFMQWSAMENWALGKCGRNVPSADNHCFTLCMSSQPRMGSVPFERDFVTC